MIYNNLLKTFRKRRKVTHIECVQFEISNSNESSKNILKKCNDKELE